MKQGTSLWIAAARATMPGCYTGWHDCTREKRMEPLNFRGSFRESLRHAASSLWRREGASSWACLHFRGSFAKSHLGWRQDGSPFHRLLVFIEMDFNHYSVSSLAIQQCQTAARCPLGIHSICFHTRPNLFKGAKSIPEWVMLEGRRSDFCEFHLQSD